MSNIRLSTSMMYQQSLSTMLAQQSEVAASQNQVSSGKRINVASDDPTGAAQMVALNHILASNAQYSSSIQSANTRLSTESSTLDSVNSLLQRVHDLGLKAGDAVLSDADRQSMATELKQIQSQLLQLANTTDGNGNALFAGTSTTTTPFTLDASGAVSYSGNDTQSMSTIGDGLKIANTDTGSAIFMNISAGNGSFVASAPTTNTGSLVVGASSVTDASAWSSAVSATAAEGGSNVDYAITFDGAGNWSAVDENSTTTPKTVVGSGTYTDGGSISFNGLSVTMTGTPAAGDTMSVQSGQSQDVFTTLTKMIDALQTPVSGTANGPTQLANTMNRQLESLDQAMDNITNVQVQAGSRISSLSDQASVYTDLNLTYTSALSDVRDVDMATAIGNLTLQSTALQASQQVFAKVQSMSLFDYLK